MTLEGHKYQAVRACSDPLAEAVIENYRLWASQVRWTKGLDPEVRSSTPFDTVAIYLVFSEELVKMERLGIRVTEDGFAVIDKGARPARCATAWRDLEAFEDLVVQRLTGSAIEQDGIQTDGVHA